LGKLGKPIGQRRPTINPTRTMDFLSHPAFWIVVAAASELIALSPLKSNSVVQLVFQMLHLLKAKKP
jgi:hypothetical protein